MSLLKQTSGITNNTKNLQPAGKRGFGGSLLRAAPNRLPYIETEVHKGPGLLVEGMIADRLGECL
ncbi:hypothetical protein D3C75_1339080 [compost metagenome]